MHSQVWCFVEGNLDKLQGRVLEVGSRNVNGSVRDLVPHAVGTDMEKGRNVDEVCAAENLLTRFGPETFDAVMSFDAFEHIKDWRACITNMWGVLKTGGYLVMTMAHQNKGRHAYPDDYWRASWEHIKQIFPDAEDMEEFGPSMGWTVKKAGPLPDLAAIHLIEVP